MAVQTSGPDLPAPRERELRARWFATLTEEERDEMTHRSFAWIEATFLAWHTARQAA